MPGPPVLPGGLVADVSPWKPPPSPLTSEELQQGAVTIPKVADELARDPIPVSEALQQWSALPALSHFLAASMRVRELLNRFNEPHMFRPPPRVTLTDQRRNLWLAELASGKGSLRKLSRAVPHGISGSTLLSAVAKQSVPVGRAIWFVRCVGTNELRAIKRRGGSTEDWFMEWTSDVIKFLEITVNAFPEEGWSARMQYATRLVALLVYERLVRRQQFLEWLFEQAEDTDNYGPAYEHVLNVLWVFSPPSRLVQVASRSKSPYLIRRLAKDHEDALVDVKHWSEIRDVLKTVDPLVFQRVSERIDCLTIAPLLHTCPEEWTAATRLANILDTFTIPYRFRELVSAILSSATGKPPRMVVCTLLLWAVRRGDPSSTQLCLALLRRFARAGVTVSEHLISFLMGTDVLSTPCLFDIIAECLRTDLLSLENYLYQLIASGKLYTSGKDADRQRRILRNLPFSMMKASARSEVRMLIKEPPGPALPDLTALLNQILRGDRLLSSNDDITNLEGFLLGRTKNQRLLVAKKMVILHRAVLPQSVAILEPYVALLETACGGSISPLYHALAAILSSATTAEVAVFAVRQVHARLLTFVCAGLVDSFVAKFLDKARELGAPPVLLESSKGLQPVIRDPTLLFDFNIVLSRGQTQAAPTTATSHIQSINDQTSKLSDSLSSSKEQLSESVQDQSGTDPTFSNKSPQATSRGDSRAGSASTGLIALTPHDSTFDTQLAQALKDSTLDLTVLLELYDDKEHHDQFKSGLLGWIRNHCADYRTIIQLITYRLISIAAVDDEVVNDRLMLSLLLVPPNQIGLCYEEMACLDHCRREYLETAPLPRLLDVLVEAAQDVDRPCTARIATAYPDLYIDRIIKPCLNEPKLLARLQLVTTASKSFAELLGRCNPFNLVYYQGMVLVALAGQTRKEVAESVLSAAESRVDKCSALKSILVYVDNATKSEILLRTIQRFFKGPEMPPPAVSAYVTLMGSLGAAGLEGHDSADLNADMKSGIRMFIESAISCPSNPQLLPALVGIIKVGIVFPQSQAQIVTLLEGLQRLPYHDTSYQVRTTISDALRLIIHRLDDQSSAHEEDKSFHRPRPTVPVNIYETGTDNLMLYSRSQDAYKPLNISPFDLIEDAGSAPGVNDSPFDLCQFETYLQVENGAGP